VSTTLVVFEYAINPSTFTVDQFVLTGPAGPAHVTSVTPLGDGTNARFVVDFDPQTVLGRYTLSIGPNIRDPFGNPMAAPYGGSFELSDERIVNGGFETGDFTGWMQSGNPEFTGVFPGNAHSGSYAAFLGPEGGEGFLSQFFPTIPGTSYTLDYWLRHDGGPYSSFRALIDQVPIPDSVLNSPPAFAYTEFRFAFTARTAQTWLMFGFRDDPSFFWLDDVSVRPSGPAPAPHSGSGGRDTLGGVTLVPTLPSTGSEIVAAVPVAPVGGGANRQAAWEAAHAHAVAQMFGPPASANSAGACTG
jgi:flagellin